VQSFISQARKTHDLFAGSHILSLLVQKALKKLKNDKFVKEFIFPSDCIISGNDIQSIPNRFIILLESENIKKTGEELEQYVKNEFIIIAKDIFETIVPPSCDKAFYAEFKKQIENFFTINWIALPFLKNEYQKSYNEIEKLLGGVKNVRNFKQIEETPGRKCSICGERNALFYKGDSNSFKYNNTFRLNGNNSVSLTDGEGLCAIDFVKRVFEKNKIFPSTSKISLIDTIEKLDKNGKTLIKEYQQNFNYEFDEQLFYEENITERYFVKNNIKHNNSIEVIKKKQKELVEYIKEKNLKLCKYYALVMLDGDSMGEWLSGRLLNIEDDERIFLTFHKRLTEELVNYTNKIKAFINEPIGDLIYAGGDDLLAFVNLNHLPGLLKNIREKFPHFEDITINGRNPVKGDKKSTASCGVVIAHYKTPLSEVLKKVRQMEKEAKRIDSDKDACAIAVLKHSGDIVETVFKWKYNKDFWVTDLMDKLIKMLIKDKISGNFITNLNKEFLSLMDDKGQYCEDNIVESEIQRLVKRSVKQKEDNVNEETSELIEHMKTFYTPPMSLKNFLSFLNIIRFITREVHYAD
jgi:CRISPR-associated protein Cmr2